ncbi:ATP-binding cassette domain-containing protein [Mesorhizobium sp. 1M-11]|uniref:ABC transporter ATP-binding protein n=1 Tax=Mesorhizobium sp. 1M-11 TaxID=1529006 RepID=UPI0006C76DFF|nr:ATP-binding cassette domain-containing protein [Mesorhizobium sp. 1M-11]
MKLQVRDLRKAFGALEVLKGVSLDAYEHDVISILGASGSGKSTFLRCINFLEAPTGGTIKLNDEAIKTWIGPSGNQLPADPKQLQRVRSKLAMVFQNFNLWSHMTVMENVIEGPISVLGVERRQAIANAERLLEKVGLSDRRNYYPALLSGGQQQRAAIARALAMDPEVLLFDEPTSALDPELVGEVLAIIRALAAEGRTMIIVTHEMAFARDASTRVIFFREGQIEEEGPPDQTMTRPASLHFQRFLARSHR